MSLVNIVVSASQWCGQGISHALLQYAGHACAGLPLPFAVAFWIVAASTRFTFYAEHGLHKMLKAVSQLLVNGYAIERKQAFYFLILVQK